MSEASTTTITTHRVAIPVLMLVVICGGFAARFYGEVFPIAPWAMYSRIDSEYDYYVVKIHEWDGERLPEPRMAAEIPELRRKLGGGRAIRNLRFFGQAVRNMKLQGKNFEKAQRHRAFLEGDVLPEGTVYELMYLRGNPLDLYVRQRFDEGQPIARFTSGGPWPKEVMKKVPVEERTP